MRIDEYLQNYTSSKSDIEHALCVKKLSLEIYEKLSQVFPSHELLNFKNDKKLIKYSAQLHDIGTFFEGANANKPHNKTGAKLVLQNGIDDLTDNEIKVVAASIRYHRGSRPKDGKHRLYSSFEQCDKNKVRVISSVLRLADALDFNHMQQVENILLAYDFDHFTLTLNPCINIMFNMGIKGAFDKKKTLFEEVFRVKIRLEND